MKNMVKSLFPGFRSLEHCVSVMLCKQDRLGPLGIPEAPLSKRGEAGFSCRHQRFVKVTHVNVPL